LDIVNLNAYCAAITINETMYYNTPKNQFMMPIHVPQVVWTGNLVFATLDGCALTQGPSQLIHPVNG
jgi:hypothetical protein